MNKTRQHFWNKGYTDGFDYRQISDSRVSSILDATRPKKILDIGCGTGTLARQLHKLGGSLTGIDISNTAIEKAIKESSSEITFKVLDVENEDISTLGKFDLVTMKLVFAFLEDKGSVISKIKDALSSGGYFVVINPVIFDHEKATTKIKGISVDDSLTMQIENFGFKFVSKSSEPLSDAHELTTYIFKAN